MAPYDFSVEYQRGKLNVVADVLSRMTNWLDERETDSYLWMVEENASVEPVIGDQNEKQSQDYGDEYELPWPPPRTRWQERSFSVRRSGDALLTLHKPCLMASPWELADLSNGNGTRASL